VHTKSVENLATVQEVEEPEMKEIDEEESRLGLTDLEKAYRDILNEPVSPTSIGGMKSFIRAFKH